MTKKVVLAYSGGLDTSVILKWLINKGYEVVCFLANLGQNEDFSQAAEKAKKLGAQRVYIEDLRQEFIEEYIYQALKADAIYEGKYLLGTALARPLIAKKQVEIAYNEKADYLAHGATGKGNDQVRFELAYLTLMPHATIISPWKDPEFFHEFRGRPDMIRYAEEQGIPITSTLAKPYSMDENLMHISYEGGILEDPAHAASADMFQRTVSPQDAPEEPTQIAIRFFKGVPAELTNLTTGECFVETIALYQHLNEIAAKNGIGRIDLVESRFVGMKSRGVYETPAGTVLLTAHLDLQGLVLDREVFQLKLEMMPKIAKIIYNGFWFSPEMEFLMAAINKSQEHVEGIVYMTLYKGNAYVTHRESSKSLYNHNVASMDHLGDYNQEDAKGFIRLQALRLKR